MGESSGSYHEPYVALDGKTRDRHRGLVSLQEELEAIDWYQQRMDACGDPMLRAILDHNREEEVEHAAMLLEWLRRGDPDFDRHLRDYLFTTGDITRIESAGDQTSQTGASRPASWLTIGSLKGDE